VHWSQPNWQRLVVKQARLKMWRSRQRNQVNQVNQRKAWPASRPALRELRAQRAQPLRA
jgi:hypothetical protein